MSEDESSGQSSQDAPKWMERAKEDISAVEVLLSAGLVSSAAVHCQQAAEKIAKATLICLGEDYPKIHDVGRLGRLLASKRHDIAERVADLAGVTDWYMIGRYPDEGFFLPSAADVQAALEKVKELQQIVRLLIASDR